MSARSARNVETQKKKAKRRIPREPQARNQGNTGGIRRSLRKEALKRQGREAAAAG